ncbi:MAG TPA: NADH-quinone oxidoreductase subunit J [Actinobacteria bacterium]|nr:NADH-quinone oxidoreductase subunit J [Actinomycetota bacterium]
MVELILFVILSAVVIGGALSMVLGRNPVYAAMGMLATLFGLAVIYVIQLAHFVAVVQVIVYAGAVMTLFLFVIMFIGVDKAQSMEEGLAWQRPAVLVVVAAIVAAVGGLVLSGRWEWITGDRITSGGQLAQIPEAPNGTIEAIGESLINRWLLPFEATAALLIIASVAAIVLAFYRPRRVSPATEDSE